MEKSNENRFSRFQFPLPALVILLMASCSPTQKQMNATRTFVADNIFGTQAALAPTAAFTLTPTITITPTPSPSATNTPEPTGTLLPPTPTSDAEGIERMKLCYKAAVIVYADYEALYMDKGWTINHSPIDEVALNKLRAERKSRYESLKQNVDVCLKSGSCWKEDVLSVDGIIMMSQDCMGYRKIILRGNSDIQGCPPKTTNVGMLPQQCANLHRRMTIEAVHELEEALLKTYGVDSEELEAIAAPIWQNVYKRYSVEIPVEN